VDLKYEGKARGSVDLRREEGHEGRRHGTRQPRTHQGRGEGKGRIGPKQLTGGGSFLPAIAIAICTIWDSAASSPSAIRCQLFASWLYVWGCVYIYIYMYVCSQIVEIKNIKTAEIKFFGGNFQ
jgi:hypothetical protein